MIGFLTSMGLGKRGAQIVAFIVIPLLILGAFYLMLDAYGDSRYRAGVSETDAKWEEAGRRLEEQARQSASAADKAAAKTIEAHNERVEAEKERIDEAIREGSSPLDVLFGTDGSVVRQEDDYSPQNP